jgi:(1->4)-alpha-D-glucan 1-alpha-D-glucosylmutase
MANTGTPGTRPRAATYRVQLHAGFTFDDAAAISGYLASLGVSHLYCSPYLQAAPGSTHGYDVIDHSRLNAELGGAAGHARLTAALAGAGLRQVLDIVPNHMAVGPAGNAWWQDVLASGVESRFADHFDIDWDPPQPLLAGKVLVPVLGDHYGRVLEAGELRVARGAGGLVVRYYDHELPLAHHTQLSDPEIEALNSDADALDALLRRQNYRLAHWRTAAEEINYRRFFDISTLAGLRAEDPQVFADTHHLILAMIRDGTLDGLRVDHVDGLADPAGYLERLHAETGGAYVVVEKILEAGEDLPATWPVAGTTGYDFATAIGQLFTDPAGEAPMRTCYERFTGEGHDWKRIVHAAKLEIMHGSLAAEVERLTHLLAHVTDHHRRERDFTRRQLRETLCELLAAFDVYRGYAYPGRPVSEADAACVAAAVAAAQERRPDLDGELAGFVGELLTCAYPGSAENDFAVHFAQVSAPVMAKGVEDTAFYRYHVLTSLCEVGGDPGTFGRPAGDFHSAMAAAARHWPQAMLTLSTHDTKRSADVRARISLLAECPQAWEQAVTGWARHNERHKSAGWPDRNAEYLLYQNLVGAWPIETARAGAFMAKAVKEAKVHTSWTDPVPAYDDAVQAFVAAILADPWFVASLEEFLAGQQLVERGRISSLAQTTLLLTCPGVPDIYQGSEVWDLSLVDPDNRRPVDYAARERLLAALAGAGPHQALERMADGGPKQWLIARLLAHRARAPQAYAPGSGYEPLAVAGEKADHLVAFTRGGSLAVIVPRLVGRLGGGPWGLGAWGDTAVTLPPGSWHDVLTGEQVSGGAARVEALLARFPVTVLAPDEDVPSVTRLGSGR